MGAITYQKDAGFNQGLSMLGQALGQVLHKRAQESHFKTISDTVEKEGITPTTLEKIISMPSGAEYLQHMAPLLAPYLKEQAKIGGAQKSYENSFDDGSEPNFGQRDMWSEGQLPTTLQSIVGQQLPESPIAMAAKYRAKTNTGAPIKITPTEEKRNGTTNVPYISGVPNNPASDATSNRRGPVEQEKFQQGGHAGMGVEPPSERDRDIQNWINQAKPNGRPSAGSIPVGKNREINDLSESQLSKLSRDPYTINRDAAKAEIQRRSTRGAALLKVNEPKLADMRETLTNAKQSGLGFDRMKEILDQEGDKFPSGITSAMLDLEGEGGLSKLGRTQMHPAAQEFIKLVVNQLKDAKDTYGSRLTNLDVATYLRGLPSLINTPDGRQRILHQLRTLNQINQLHYSSVLEEVERAGGSDRIALSTAEILAEKRIKNQMDDLHDRFIHPNKKVFSTPPDPRLYKRVRDRSTGEVLVSDGTSWKREVKK